MEFINTLILDLSSLSLSLSLSPKRKHLMASGAEPGIFVWEAKLRR